MEVRKIITQTELTNRTIAANGTPTMAEIIMDFIQEHDTTDMQTGVRYYNNDNDIRKRNIYYWKDGVRVVDETRKNNRLPHNWHKLLVDQKANYLVGNPVTFAARNLTEEEKESTDDEEFVEKINDLLAEKFDDDIWELCKDASNKGLAWLHPFIDEEGNFDYAVVDAMEVVPIWETTRQRKLVAVIRYYILKVNGQDRIRAEYWTREGVQYYQESEDGKLVLEKEEGHFLYNGEWQSWGKVPFIAFKNNEEMVSDLQAYKDLIDAYDRAVSDLDNTLEEIQEAVLVLKGYRGQNLDELHENLRYHKAVSVDGQGGVEYLTAEIPIQAKKEHLDRLEENIYTFGQGVNTKTDRFGTAPSGVALKFMYALLDMKADKTERKFKKALREFLWFIAEYFKYAEKKEYDYRAIQITFNKSSIINEAEKIQSATISKGLISDETIIANHPWVENPQEELRRLEEQKQQAQDLYGTRLFEELNAITNETAGVEL